MKKFAILATMGLVVIPSAAMARNDAPFMRQPAQQQQQNRASDLPVRFFVEYGVNAFSSVETDIRHDGQSLASVRNQGFNDGGSVSLGIDINGIQLSLAPRWSSIGDGVESTQALWANALIPLVFDRASTGGWVPFVSLGGGVVRLSSALQDVGYNWHNFDETGFGWQVGLGTQYWFDDHVFISTSISYQQMRFNDVIGVIPGVDVAMQGWGIGTSLGYRF